MSNQTITATTNVFMFTDIVGSTELTRRQEMVMQHAIPEHISALKSLIVRYNGEYIKATGDGIHAVFKAAENAIHASIAVQHYVKNIELGGKTDELLVRIGLHAGVAERKANDFYGLEVNRAQRLMAVAHGGQILVSATIHALMADRMLAGIDFKFLGHHRLDKSFPSEAIYQVIAPGLLHKFPSLQSRHDIPSLQANLLGRDIEVKRITTYLRGKTRLLTLHGASGVGKTSLALRIINSDKIRSFFRDSVYWIELEKVDDPNQVVSLIASAVHLGDAGRRDLSKRLHHHLRDKHVLLTLDNFEHVREAVDEITRLLAECAEVKILVTSRALLQVREEVAISVEPFHFSDDSIPHIHEKLRRNPAVALFVRTARRYSPHFHLSVENADEIVKICNRLEGIPLAIELAASRLTICTLPELLKELDSSILFLEDPRHNAPERQRTLRDTVAWSYNLLSESEMRLFRQLSLFNGAFTLEAAHSVCAAQLDGEARAFESQLRILINSSLVNPVEEPTAQHKYFRMFDIMREFGREQLDLCHERRAGEERFAAYFIQRVENATAVIFSPHLSRYLDLITGEYVHFRAVLAWAERNKLRQLGLQLAGALAPYWYNKGELSEGMRWLESFLHMEPQPASTNEARARLGCGLLLWAQGHFREAQRQYENGVTLYQRVGNEQGGAIVNYHLATLARDRGEIETAEKLFEQCLTYWQSPSDETAWWVAATECSLGDIFQDRGALDRATYLYEKSLHTWNTLDDNWGKARALGGLWGVNRWRSNYASAIHLCLECQELYHQLGDKRGVALTTSSLGMLYREIDEYETAQIHYEQSRALLDELGADEDRGFLLLLLGELHLIQHHYDVAAQLYQESLRLFRDFKNKWGFAEVHFRLGGLAMEKQDYLSAAGYYMQSLGVFNELGKTISINGCLERIGIIACHFEQYDLAARLYGKAQGLRQAVGIHNLPIDRERQANVTATLKEKLGKNYNKVCTAGKKLGTGVAITVASDFVNSLNQQ